VVTGDNHAQAPAPPTPRRGLRRVLPRGRRGRVALVAAAVAALAGILAAVFVVLSPARPTVTFHYGKAAFDVAAFSPDGKLVATGGGQAGIGGLVVLWDTSRWTSVAAIRTGVDAPVTALTFSPDGTILAGSGSTDTTGTVWLWSAASHQVLGTVPVTADPMNLSLAFSPDGRQLALGGLFGPVQVWDVARRQLLATAPAGTPGVVAAYRPDGALLATGGAAAKHGATTLWEPARQQTLTTLTEDDTDYLVDAVAFSPDGRLLATGGYLLNLTPRFDFFGHTTLWDTTSHQRVAILDPGGAGPVQAVAFSPNGRLLATAGIAAHWARANLWDVSARRLVRTVPIDGAGSKVHSLAFSTDGSLLLIASLSGNAQLWRI
jgi:WD40 repeat protein